MSKRFISVLTSYLSLVCLICFATKDLNAQVAVGVGAQTFYDDNIFLENGENRPAPIVANSDLTQNFPAGFNTLQNFDGEENSDIITNLYTEFSGKLPILRQSVESNYNLRLGSVLFTEFGEQNRFTVDGQLSTSLSKNLIPEPFYLRATNAIQSTSNNLSVAAGTVTQSTQNYLISGETGVANARITRDLTYDLGYTGAYQLFLGSFYLSKDENASNTEQQGTDFHSHTARTALKYQVNRSLEIGGLGQGGVQLFTKIHEGAFGPSTQKPEDLDNLNGQLQGTSKYTLSRSFYLDGSAGFGYSKLLNDPVPRTITTIGEDGQTTSEIVTPSASNTGLTYTGALNYAYRPGALATLGSTQGFATNLDGQRFLTRMVFGNIIETLTNDLQLTLGGRFIQFEDESDTRRNTNRMEGSISLNYHLTENTSLNCGYNYSDQKADGDALTDELRFTSPEYTSNRFFVGITSGFVGLPL
jgi:hypothetical protein